MIQHIYIKNFKVFTKSTIKIDLHNIIIGENDSGKSSILQALDFFFNQDKIDKIYVPDLTKNVEIGIMVDDVFYKKIYRTGTFKVDSSIDVTPIEHLKYIYIPVSSYEPSKLIEQLSIAKALQNTTNDLLDNLKNISQDSINEVIQGIDNELVIIDSDPTTITGEQAFKYESALKFSVKSNGIAVDARGSGFQKNLMYTLLVGNNYENVILGIDEIENSFSVNNCKEMIMKLHNNIGQTLMTTHSKKIMEVSNNSNIIPMFSETYKTLAELLKGLDDTNEKVFLLVEGKFDLPWYKKALELLNRANEFIVLPSGGSNSTHLKNEIERNGISICKIIQDGDTRDTRSLTRDCIELYTPLEILNDISGLNLEEIPATKTLFFQALTTDTRNEDSVKSIISSKVNSFLTIDNPLINEIQQLLDD